MRTLRALLAFVAVAILWAVFVWLFARRLVGDGDIVLITALGAAYGMVWQGAVNLTVLAVRRIARRELTAIMYMATAAGVSAGLTFLLDLFVNSDVRGAFEAALGGAVAGLVSALVFVLISGMRWRR